MIKKIRIFYDAGKTSHRLGRYCLHALLAAGLSLLTSGRALADEESAVEFRFDGKRDVLPWMPLEVKVELVNGSDQPLGIYQWPNMGMSFRIRSKDGGILFKGVTEPLFSPPDRSKQERILKSTEMVPRMLDAGGRAGHFVILRSRWKLVETQLSGQHRTVNQGALFPESGSYRVSLGDGLTIVTGGRGERQKREWTILYSDPQVFEVVEPERYEAALEAVRSLSSRKVLLEPLHVAHDLREQEEAISRLDNELKAFVSEHGDTPWAPLAWHARAHLAGAREAYGEQAELAKKAVELAERLEVPWVDLAGRKARAAALEELGREEEAAQVRRELEAIETARREAAGWDEPPRPEGADRQDIAAQLEGYRKFRELQRDLRRRGYMISRLSELAPEAWEAYNKARERWNKKVMTGELSVAEGWRRWREMLERIAVENLPRMTQEEIRAWRREQVEESERLRAEWLQRIQEDPEERARVEAWLEENLSGQTLRRQKRAMGLLPEEREQKEEAARTQPADQQAPRLP